MGIVGPAFVDDAETDYTPVHLANYYIEKFGGDEGISHMKLQKLVYLAYGWWLSFYEKPLLRETPEVWRYGPVFDSLYQTLRTKGREPINDRISPFFEFSGEKPALKESDTKTANLLDWVWERYGELDGIALSEITHQPDTPWSAVVKSHEYKIPRNLPLDWDLVKEHYRKIRGRLEHSENIGNRIDTCAGVAERC